MSFRRELLLDDENPTPQTTAPAYAEHNAADLGFSTPNKWSKKKKLIVWGSVAGVAVIVLIVVLAVSLSGGSSSTTSDPDDPTDPEDPEDPVIPGRNPYFSRLFSNDAFQHGTIQGMLDFTTYTILAGTSKNTVFVSKLSKASTDQDPDKGNVAWTNTAIEISKMQGGIRGLYKDTSGNIYVVGEGKTTSADEYVYYTVAKISSSGALMHTWDTSEYTSAVGEAQITYLTSLGSPAFHLYNDEFHLAVPGIFYSETAKRKMYGVIYIKKSTNSADAIKHSEMMFGDIVDTESEMEISVYYLRKISDSQVKVIFSQRGLNTEAREGYLKTLNINNGVGEVKEPSAAGLTIFF